MTRVLVTGGGGFLGSHLVERLEDEGHDVFSARRRDYDLTRREDTERLFRHFEDAERECASLAQLPGASFYHRLRDKFGRLAY